MPSADPLLPPMFWQGVEQFNQQQYYACHDTLEALWSEAVEPQRRFYQGLLQIAVALHHLGNHNWQGAVTLLGEGIHRLQPYQPDYAGIDVAALLDQSMALLSTLQKTDPSQVTAMLQQLEWADKSTTAIELGERGQSFPVIVKLREQP